jgi:hypothetical protein
MKLMNMAYKMWWIIWQTGGKVPITARQKFNLIGRVSAEAAICNQ